MCGSTCSATVGLRSRGAVGGRGVVSHEGFLEATSDFALLAIKTAASTSHAAKRDVNGCLGLSGLPNVYTGRPVATSNVVELSGVRICPRCLSGCVGCTARINRVSLHGRPNMLAVCTVNRGRGPYGVAVLRACTDRTTCRGRVTSRRFRECGLRALRVIGSLVLSSRAPLGPTGGLGGFVRWGGCRRSLFGFDVRRFGARYCNAKGGDASDEARPAH